MEREGRAPNPEAIAWYLGRCDDLLAEQQSRVAALRTRGGQFAGFSGAVLALVGADAGPILESLGQVARVMAGAALFISSIGLMTAFVIALRATAIATGVSDVSAREPANYLTERFTHEPDLWRVQLRTIKAMVGSIEATTQRGDAVERAVAWSSRCFLVGLIGVATALGILVVMVTVK